MFSICKPELELNQLRLEHKGWVFIWRGNNTSTKFRTEWIWWLFQVFIWVCYMKFWPQGLMNSCKCWVLSHINTIFYCLLCFSPGKLIYFSLEGKEGRGWMCWARQGNVDSQSEPDAWEVMHLELSARPEMKRKWSENPGEEFPDQISWDLSALAEPWMEGKTVPSSSLKHWPM